MAIDGVPFENVASRFEGLLTSPSFVYSFETQTSVPVDGTNSLSRTYSPFTIRVVPPAHMSGAISSSSSRDVNLLGRADSSVSSAQRIAEAKSSVRGVDAVVNPSARTIQLESAVANGRLLTELSLSGEDPVVTLVSPYTLLDAAYQLTKIVNFPPLILLVNPSEMNITYGVVQDYSDRGREGHIFQRWGEGQPSISFSGSTGAFISGSLSDLSSTRTGRDRATPVSFPWEDQTWESRTPLREPGSEAASAPTVIPVEVTEQMKKTDVPSGVSFAAKRDSAAFQNFMALYHFYRNNGMMYETIGGTEVPLAMGAIAIDYDQMTYVGHIESFNYSYEQDSPHKINWDMEFIVDAMYDSAETPMAVLPMVAPQPGPTSPATHGTEFEFGSANNQNRTSGVHGFFNDATLDDSGRECTADLNNLPGESLDNWRLFTGGS